MTEQEFNELLQQIENGTFVGDKLEIFGINTFDEEIGDRINLDDEKVILLAKILKKNPSITKVNLRENNIGDAGANALANINTIKELNLNENHISPEGVIYLAKNNIIKILSLEQNPLWYKEDNHEQYMEMTNALINNDSITELNLGGCYLGNIMVTQLLQKNIYIKTLSLNNNSLTDIALEFIADNYTLKVLHLSENEITDQGMKYISKNNHLTTLNICHTKITDIGAQLLSTSSSLKELYAVITNMTANGIKHFVNSNLEVIKVDNPNTISVIELYNFYHAFEEAKQLRNNGINFEDDVASQDTNFTNLAGDMDYQYE